MVEDESCEVSDLVHFGLKENAVYTFIRLSRPKHKCVHVPLPLASLQTNFLVFVLPVKASSHPENAQP